MKFKEGQKIIKTKEDCCGCKCGEMCIVHFDCGSPYIVPVRINQKEYIESDGDGYDNNGMDGGCCCEETWKLFENKKESFYKNLTH